MFQVLPPNSIHEDRKEKLFAHRQRHDVAVIERLAYGCHPCQCAYDWRCMIAAGRGAPAANGQHQASPGQGEEPEEGELPEDGELPLLSEGDPAKRRRMDGTSSESYR